MQRDCNAYGKEDFSSRSVSEEAIVIIEEEIGSLKEKRDYKRGSVHAHTNRVITMENSSIKVYFLVK